MQDFQLSQRLPENLGWPENLAYELAAWSEDQVALGRARSVQDYLSQLVEEDRREMNRLSARRTAVAQGRASGISMQAADAFLARWLTEPEVPANERLKAAIREGRQSGYSRASIEGILDRSLLASVAQAA